VSRVCAVISDAHGDIYSGLVWGNGSILFTLCLLIILAETEVAMPALLKKVWEWCSLWDINVNSNKSAVIHFLPSHLPINGCYLYTRYSNCPKIYLPIGVVLDEHLTFQEFKLCKQQ